MDVCVSPKRGWTGNMWHESNKRCLPSYSGASSSPARACVLDPRWRPWRTVACWTRQLSILQNLQASSTKRTLGSLFPSRNGASRISHPAARARRRSRVISFLPSSLSLWTSIQQLSARLDLRFYNRKFRRKMSSNQAFVRGNSNSNKEAGRRKRCMNAECWYNFARKIKMTNHKSQKWRSVRCPIVV